MAAQMTKSLLIEKIATETDLAKRDVKAVIETLAAVGYKELKKIGVFLVPGFAKFVVIKKPATKERQGTNPFTKEPMTFKAKPARAIAKNRSADGSDGTATPYRMAATVSEPPAEAEPRLACPHRRLSHARASLSRPQQSDLREARDAEQGIGNEREHRF